MGSAIESILIALDTQEYEADMIIAYVYIAYISLLLQV